MTIDIIKKIVANSERLKCLLIDLDRNTYNSETGRL